jgi:hypothetical protein
MTGRVSAYLIGGVSLVVVVVVCVWSSTTFVV